jgi:hypothetical protein
MSKQVLWKKHKGRINLVGDAGSEIHRSLNRLILELEKEKKSKKKKNTHTKFNKH